MMYYSIIQIKNFTQGKLRNYVQFKKGGFKEVGHIYNTINKLLKIKINYKRWQKEKKLPTKKA